MTREEAIKMLDKWYGLFPSEAYEALDMAIEALNCSEKPNGSLIRRQDAIRIMACEMRAEAMREGYGDNLVEDYIPEATAWMNDAPSVKPKTGECRTCKRNADNGGVYEDGRTKCPIQEHYALLLDGYCHLYEQI